MTESEWLTCADPVAMLDYLSHAGNRHECATERKLWLFVCAVQRAWWGEAPRRDLASITTLERMADADNVTRPGLENVHFTYTVPPDARDAALECVRVHNSRGDSKKWAAIIRDIVGNPFRPVELWKERTYYPADDTAPITDKYPASPWLTPTVLSLAQATYDTRLPDGTLDSLRLAVLADALEEAGCDNVEMHMHLRGCTRCMGNERTRRLGYENWDHFDKFFCDCDIETLGWVPIGPHWRGCWAVDLILGKG